MTDEYLLNLSVGYYLRSTFLVFKHRDEKGFIEQFLQEIFIFVERVLDEHQKAAFVKALLLYITKQLVQKQKPAQIAKKLKVLEWLVEIIEELRSEFD